MSKSNYGHGGAREGAGAPKKPHCIKKKQVGIALAPWLIAKIDELVIQKRARGEKTSRAREIEAVLLSSHGWSEPDKDSQR